VKITALAANKTVEQESATRYNRRQPISPRPPMRDSKQISPQRKQLYYVGMAVSAVGLLLFLSVFVSGALNFGNFDNFEARGRSMGLRAFGGMALIMVGGMLMKLGAKGLAGSGVVLDPEQARDDLKPWSKLSGGVMNDAISEIDVVQKLGRKLDDDGPTETPPPVVKLRCRQCQALNDETDKFCGQCGTAL
jgi:hypothetical protein